MVCVYVGVMEWNISVQVSYVGVWAAYERRMGSTSYVGVWAAREARGTGLSV